MDAAQRVKIVPPAQEQLAPAVRALQQGKHDRALALALEAAERAPGDFAVQMEAGRLCLALTNAHGARECFLRALKQQPGSEVALLGLGHAFLRGGELTKAVGAFETLTKRAPNSVDAHIMCGVAKNQLQLERDAEPYLRRAVELDGRHAEARHALGSFLVHTHRPQEAEEHLRLATELDPNCFRYWFTLGQALVTQGDAEAARTAYARACALEPDDLRIRWAHFRAVPVLYESEAELELWEGRTEPELDELIALWRRLPEANRAAASDAIIDGFHFHYRAGNPLALQKKLGGLVHEIMSSRYPQYANAPTRRTNIDRVRIGFVSSMFVNHTIYKLFSGLIRELASTSQFDVHVYHFGSTIDECTRQLKKSVTNFHYEPALLDNMARRISSDALDVLIYPEVGMDQRILRMAALRLAPVQCTACGHPVTSGLPSIDYMLSGDLVEAEDADAHYTERLERLPGLGLYLPPIQLDPVAHDRASFGLDEEATVYLSCQSLFKYMPRYDILFPQIAQRVPNATFVFIEHEKSVTARFDARLQKAFAQYGLDSRRYCTILPRLTQAKYFDLNRVSDVFLDSISFSAGQSGFEALACGIAPVTLPAPYAKGRYLSAALKRIGVTTTIAASLAEYVDIAVRLGSDRVFRAQVCDQLRQRVSALYNDRAVLEGYHAFLSRVTR